MLKSVHQSPPTNEADVALAYFPDLALEMVYFIFLAWPETQDSLNGFPMHYSSFSFLFLVNISKFELMTILVCRNPLLSSKELDNRCTISVFIS